MSPEIRASTPDDAIGMDSVAQHSYVHYISRLGRRPPPMDADYASAAADDHSFVAEQDGEVVAFIVMIVAADHILVVNLAVSPSSQGVGLGTTLLEHAEELARQHGLFEVRLFTSSCMTENHRYYENRGFEESHREGDGLRERVHFRKTVSSEPSSEGS